MKLADTLRYQSRQQRQNGQSKIVHSFHCPNCAMVVQTEEPTRQALRVVWQRLRRDHEWRDFRRAFVWARPNGGAHPPAGVVPRPPGALEPASAASRSRSGMSTPIRMQKMWRAEERG